MCQLAIQPNTTSHFWPDDPATAQATNRVKSKM